MAWNMTWFVAMLQFLTLKELWVTRSLILLLCRTEGTMKYIKKKKKQQKRNLKNIIMM